MAYVIHLLDRMIRDGIQVHCVAVPGDYHEVDTIQDYHLATADWMRFANKPVPEPPQTTSKESARNLA